MSEANTAMRSDVRPAAVLLVDVRFGENLRPTCAYLTVTGRDGAVLSTRHVAPVSKLVWWEALAPEMRECFAEALSGLEPF